jgi:hypothetical protein
MPQYHFKNPAIQLYWFRRRTIPRNFDLNDCLVIAGVFTEVENVPSIADGEMILHHESGSFIKFFANGNVEIKGSKVSINEL